MLRGSLLTLVALLAIVGVVRSRLDGPSENGDPKAPKSNVSQQADQGLPARLALGQMVVARFAGPEPSPRFLARVRRGQIGGAILFAENLKGGKGGIAARIQRLQDAAEAGGNPPLLIAVDQEGGTVKRLPGPPSSSAAAMSADAARGEGEATGELLGSLGIDVDLAPVVDVGHRGSFLGSRAFSSQPGEVANRACEFAAGLRGKGVAATLKHFPGLGLATVSTDEAPVTVEASATELRRDYAPYRKCGAQPLTLVMVDSAVYPSLLGEEPAVMNPLTYRRELTRARATGVTISDDLETPAIQSRVAPARRSIEAGLDLLLYATTESTSADAYARLLEEVQRGVVSPQRVRSAAAAILKLKSELEG
ncbi:MAG TPA: glycoside hydrolase family 3 N-terminal domain-containing protein [Solirubrobacterales bacterium]